MRDEQLKILSSEALRSLLKAETSKDCPDDDLVLEVLMILEQRQPEEDPPLSPGQEKAWKRFRQRVAARKRFTLPHLARAASVVLALGLLLAAIPQQVQADGLWDRLAQWTDSFFSYLHPHLEETVPEPYQFRTDNPGLQQVYDAVLEMGITEPVVPMWLPGEYELVECKTVSTEFANSIIATFFDGNHNAVIMIRKYQNSTEFNYIKGSAPVIVIEKQGISHNVMQNNENCVIIWGKDNLECSISVDCPEDSPYEIISSIYQRRNNIETTG